VRSSSVRMAYSSGTRGSWKDSHDRLECRSCEWECGCSTVCAAHGCTVICVVRVGWSIADTADRAMRCVGHAAAKSLSLSAQCARLNRWWKAMPGRAAQWCWMCGEGWKQHVESLKKPATLSTVKHARCA
jgi:hypothetical protein